MILEKPVTYIEAFRSYHISNEVFMENVKSQHKEKKEHREYEMFVTPLLVLEENVLNTFEKSSEREKILQKIHELELKLVQMAKLQDIAKRRGKKEVI